MSATCTDCKQAMKPGNGCTITHVGIAMKRFKRFTYGQENGWTSEFCHDCNVAKGQVHHMGCDVEQCPKCGGQLIGCDC